MQNPFEITILGTSSATPTRDRNPSAQYVRLDKHYFLIDCGEATQLQLTKYNLRLQKIKYVLISHLHGDHYFGLPGLVTSMALFGRVDPLYIVCPADLKPIMDAILTIGDAHMNFEIHYIFTNPNDVETILDEDDFSIHTIPLKHRIPCTGFVIEEKGPERKINLEACERYEIPVCFYEKLKWGEDFKGQSGIEIANELLTFQGYKNRKFAYISDTIYDETIVPNISDVTLLYHEATFLHDRLQRAQETFHTTALQAGQIAKLANAKNLMIGHYSARYSDLEPLLLEAKKIHLETYLAIEGEVFQLNS